MTSGVSSKDVAQSSKPTKKAARKKAVSKKAVSKKAVAKTAKAVTKPAKAAKPKVNTETETRLGLVRRARKINRILAETYPDAHCELDFTNPYELLVATILSAQTTDKRVNMVTPTLFAKYPSAVDLAEANPEDVEQIVASTGFYRNKTKSIIGMAKGVVERHKGEVPGKLKHLVELPGVGRKTANVVLGNAFDVPGLTVDTHFQRLVRRFGWVSAETLKDPVKIEHAVGELIPKKEWTMFSHRVIWHGRRACHARKPACGACPLTTLCPSYGEGPTDPEVAAKLLRSASQMESVESVESS